ncbi:UDP-glucose--hexose-1-phosphate uridylyltransferase [Lactobacillus crispatus]|uniref:Galactose-1-phosphate uridylyltransferase n=1 Tax=Lactobacillus crispatus TaxID=47770 RepID=A0AB73BR94_9LACO|nr:UDP-glucose--hexose-1-phosphate uridylyltransferase [Lactobacillus crispatus]KAA8793876.1 UDP-glucose--hexose-1-phosphate uridylyltransferase [Lactobacillus crispatus]KAA8797749.1 UDP-glucose--hexose-1-phosphate uridylyltransferase [Lactobacillus crispatus]KAA8798863.1 UDP-glucose--hexose-1-phosphate uridylyltransferase [Lactobacillus crispatus]KAA8801337.1 UDP-glucose--hexose-1-phosphate uridylyltransferase [Lactobacillus crispatus]KAA8804255.1 UDP-glucose--hexose-1-phosphate uridylyltrans
MKVIEKFADEVINSGAYEPLDRVYVINKIRALVGDEASSVEANDEQTSVKQLVDLAVQNKKISDDVTSREVLNDQLYDLITPTPSKTNGIFWQKMQKSPEKATDWFYKLCENNNYVKKEAIAKNVVFSGTSSKEHGLEITINLSKPEKDPKAIAAAAHATGKKYPQCALCLENEGYLGGYGKNARSNLRIIRMNIGGRPWGFQYSPYAYFNEHCIFLDQKHIPMVINQQTLINLVEIEKTLPHYFVGSNADLPIVGGSMLAHEHYQGGRHTFPMMKAKIKKNVVFDDYPEVVAGIVDWPMSDLRLISDNSLDLIELGAKIINFWDHYSDSARQIKAFDGKTRHHTVTPIMHREGKNFVLDLVLRDNNTSENYPLGIFHPHKELWHIKKENIGLIEVMGRAILPGRLKSELEEVKKYWLDQDNKMAISHKEWADQIKAEQNITAENVDAVMQQALVEVFEQVLQDAGVFKNNADGDEGWDKFITALTKQI